MLCEKCATQAATEVQPMVPSMFWIVFVESFHCGSPDRLLGSVLSYKQNVPQSTGPEFTFATHLAVANGFCSAMTSAAMTS